MSAFRWKFGSVERGTVFVVRDRDTGEEVARVPVDEDTDWIDLPAGVQEGHTYETRVEEPTSGLRTAWSTPLAFQPRP